MDQIFIIKVASSFAIAGAWIAMSTLLAEKFGSKIGGLISNLPSNILVSLIFIALVNDVNYVTNTIHSIPIGISICTLFLIVFVFLLRFNLIIAIVVSLSFWLLLAFLSTKLTLDKLYINAIICFSVIAFSIIFIEKVLKIPSINNIKKKYSVLQFISRVIFSGSIVAGVVIISRYSNPHLTGIFATFPAMLLSTMIILTLNQGKEFARATGKILALSMSNTIVYVLAVYFTYPLIGIALGTIVSYSFAVLWILFLYPLVKRLI